MLPPGTPSGDETLPAALRPVVGDGAAECVWHNAGGGLTFRILEPLRYVKWAPVGSGLALGDEAVRLRWAAAWTPVPRVLDAGSTPEGEWLLTEGLPGSSAVDVRWHGDAARVARAIGTGLRRLHDALPVEGCPFDWSVAGRLAAAAARNEPPAGLEPAPPVDRLVVCHGDACAPNTLLDASGAFLGHVDLDALGVADRWADLAVATMSLGWNLPDPDGRLEGELLAAYGVDPDPVRTDFYRRLWNAT